MEVGHCVQESAAAGMFLVSLSGTCQRCVPGNLAG